MTDRIRTLVKRIAETRPIQAKRRQEIHDELRALRAQLDPRRSPDQVHSLDAALLLMEFMNRSEDVATAETLQIVASLVGTIGEELVRDEAVRLPQANLRIVPAAAGADVSEHRDLRLTQDFLLGTILLQAGVITPPTLARALQLHASSGQALGQCLIQLGAVSPEQVQSAVTYQDHLRESVQAPRPEPVAPRSTLRLTPKQQTVVENLHAQVLGEVLIRLGSITREQLAQALQVQRAASIHIGEALVETGATSWSHVKKGLEVQRKLRRVA